MFVALGHEKKVYPLYTLFTEWKFSLFIPDFTPLVYTIQSMVNISCPPITTVYVTMTNDNKNQTGKHTLQKEQFNICDEVNRKKR